jgi:hypothetical protein
VITCPVSFREGWIFLKDVADLFFPKGSKYVLLNEIPLKDADGKEIGNCDYVLARVDEQSTIIDFGLVEVQSVYISGNVPKPFKEYMKIQSPNFTWPINSNFPKTRLVKFIFEASCTADNNERQGFSMPGKRSKH